MNKLSVRGPELDVDGFRKKAVGHSPWPRQCEGEGEQQNLLNFHNLVPVPPEVLMAGYDLAGANWERENWGCTYGAFETSIVEEWEGLVVYGFQTAWSPPIEFLEKVAKEHAGLVFMLDYDEPGQGFKGIARFKADTKEDHCVSY